MINDESIARSRSEGWMKASFYAGQDASFKVAVSWSTQGRAFGDLGRRKFCKAKTDSTGQAGCHDKQ